MAGRERVMTIGTRRGRWLVSEFAGAVRELRIGLGLSRRELARRIYISESKLARWERGLPPHPDFVDSALLMQMLGHKLVLNWYPVGGELRDAGYAALVSTLLTILPSHVPRKVEAPIPLPGDLRAWDLLLRLGEARCGVAVETRLRDWQALYRREEQKARDSGVDRILFVLLDSHANRSAVAAAGRAIRDALPIDGRTVWPALRAGRDPGANGLVFLTAQSTPIPPAAIPPSAIPPARGGIDHDAGG
jgi:transcriptional regulator with XRE-family HTH domain